MHLPLRSSSWLLVLTVCVACSGGDGTGTEPNGEAPTPPAGAAGGAAPGANTTPGSKPTPGAPTAGSGSSGSNKPGSNPSKPLTGATDFSSADPNGSSSAGAGRAGGLSAAGGAMTAAPGATPPAATPAPMAPNSAADAASTSRAVERGDIYKVLDDHRILNLNAYRGLQVIDVSNVDAPRIEGRLPAVGTPLEMYVVGKRAIVLLNDWQGYYGAREDVEVERVNGGLVLNVDISDRAHPKLLSQAVVRGTISTSRLTQGGEQAALYVAASIYPQEPPYQTKTLVKSFDVSGDAITERSEIDLGGYVQDVQATAADLLLVSSIDYNQANARSQVAVIDISRADGTMVKGGSITASGVVENKFNMDAYNGILRVVSGASWSGTRENHLETFSLKELTQLKSIAHCTFGANEMLYATIFIENKGFFVTYFRQDPFHAFSIDDQGRCAEHNQFIVSGWNDFLRPTLGGTRLVGVGSNDAAQRRTVSISLYDTTNIDNPNPLLSRADLALDNSYSEAQWDDRAFSVVENAVNVKSSNGTTETGLILVPYQGYVQKDQRYVSQVQILTFSDRTLTRRGVMDHGGGSVRRSFLSDASTAANLSDEELRLYSIADPVSPAAKGRVEVAPVYRELFVYGDYVARVHDTSYYFGWNGNPNVTPPAAKVEIVRRAGDVDQDAPIVSIDVPSNATLVQAGDLLLAIVSTLDTSKTVQNYEDQVWKTHIDAYDFSDPEHPARRGSLDTTRIRPNNNYYYPFAGGGLATPPPALPAGAAALVAPPGGCFNGGCFPRGPMPASQYVVGDAVVFASSKTQQKSVGTVKRCYKYPQYSGCRVPPGGGADCGQNIGGSISCTTYKGQPEQCVGSFYECPQDGNGECKPIDRDVPTQTNCWEGEEFRYWQAYSFDALDLRDPDHLVLGDRVEMDKNDEGTSIYANDDALYYNYQRPRAGATNDPRAYVKRFFKRIEFGDPQKPSAGAGINVPGDVIAADGDTVYTRDWVWEEDAARTLVARLTIKDDLAYLQAEHTFSMRTVNAVKLDGAGHMLVASDPAYVSYVPVRTDDGKAEQPKYKLSILDAESLDVSGETDVDSWATFQGAIDGRALFSVSGGLLVINVEDPAKPAAQAYFPALSWPSNIYFDGDEAMFAGGPYGIYRFDTDVFNLLTK